MSKKLLIVPPTVLGVVLSGCASNDYGVEYGGSDAGHSH